MKNKRRQHTLLVTVLVCVTAFLFSAITGKAYGQTLQSDPEIYFEEKVIDDGKGVEIIRYNGSQNVVVIPNRIQGIPVTIISGTGESTYDKGAFENRNLMRIILPDGVTKIGYRAFADNKLISVTIPNSVTLIGDGAFFRNQLTSVTIGNSITRIGKEASSSNEITSVTLPNSVTEIYQSAFGGNPLTSITIGANVNIFNGFTEFDGRNNVSIGFEETYNNHGKLAGTYTREDRYSKTWRWQ
jgi:hypothetical protein